MSEEAVLCILCAKVGVRSPFVLKDLTQTLEMSMSPFLNAVIGNKLFPLKTAKVSP